MAHGGNEGEARQRAHDAFKSAERAGVKGKDLKTLQAQLDAATARENSAKGTPGQKRY
ncbi:hypothetical protein H7Y29_01650 [Microbacteriaceae bacterium]|nr:hypothetical protein [Candidatus Saccharibacteria bacterium]